jgi:predicted amidohydrolase YtcJ
VVPGLVDGHLHFFRLGADRGRSLDLSEARSEEEAAAQVRRLAARLKPGEWITGDNWHTGNWTRAQWPTRKPLDEAAPANPVFLGGMHSHASWANGEALAAAGITRETPDPPGGKIFRDPATGEPTGVLLEDAQRLIRTLVPQSAEPLSESVKKSIRTSYAWRSLLNTGARLVGGSDEGAKTFSPFMGIHAAVTRQDARGSPPAGWYPEQRLTRYEALKSYTLDPAYAAFQEDVLGSITPGKLADLVVLSRDIMTIPPEEILETEAVMTLVAGEAVFEREKDSRPPTGTR